MKRLLYILFLSFGLLLTACDPEAPYVTEGVNITLNVPSSTVSAASVKVDVIPENDRVYYYCGIMPDSAFSATIDLRFMEYVLDSVYLDYINWRKDLLASSSPYVASFSSHCLGYGADSHTFSGLTPETDYLIYAFCVNPETNQPMGQLFKTTVRTGAYHPSDMTFTYSIEHKKDGLWLTIEPSADTEPYVWDLSETSAVNQYGGVPGYVDAYMSLFKETGQTDYVLVRGYTYFNLTNNLEAGEDYTIMVAGYDGNLTTPIHHCNFTYDPACEDSLHVDFLLIE